MDQPKTPKEVDEDLTLRAWEGEDSVKGEILLAHGMSLERSIANILPDRLKHHAEDVICEAIARFWESKDKYNGDRPLGAYLYTIAKNIAIDLSAGKLGWQKSQKKEQRVDREYLESFEEPSDVELNDVEAKNKGFVNALRESMTVLSNVERDVIEAYGLANNQSHVDAAHLGVELGHKHKNGVPIPKGTIRQHKFRGKEKLAKAMRERGHDLENPGGKR